MIIGVQYVNQTGMIMYKLQKNDLCKVYTWCDSSMNYKEFIGIVLETENDIDFNTGYYDLEIIEVFVNNKIDCVEIHNIEKL